MSEVILLDDYRIEYPNLVGLEAVVDEDGLMTFRPVDESGGIAEVGE